MSEEEKPPQEPKWEYRKNFPIQENMADVIRKTMDVVRAELETAKRKLHKAKYGS